jgi:hypothetical protein
VYATSEVRAFSEPKFCDNAFLIAAVTGVETKISLGMAINIGDRCLTNGAAEYDFMRRCDALYRLGERHSIMGAISAFWIIDDV